MQDQAVPEMNETMSPGLGQAAAHKFKTWTAPPRTEGPISGDPTNDHEQVMLERQRQADGRLRQWMNKYLTGMLDSKEPITDVSIWSILRKEKGMLGGGLSDSWKLGREYMRQVFNGMDAAHKKVAEMLEQSELDKLPLSQFRPYVPPKVVPERGEVHRMNEPASEVSTKVRPDTRVKVNVPHSENMIGPNKMKLLTKSDEDKARGTPDKSAYVALPPPPKLLEKPSKEEIQAAKGKKAAQDLEGKPNSGEAQGTKGSVTIEKAEKAGKQPKRKRSKDDDAR